jgi:hypothetical protein
MDRPVVASFVCSECGEHHREMPLAYRLEFPVDSLAPGTAKFERDGELIVAGDDRFILANIELPVKGLQVSEFVWTCWISLSGPSYQRMRRLWNRRDREQQEAAFGYVSSALPTYEPSTVALKSRVHTRAVGLRPSVELEPTEHPLALEQRDGIGQDRIAAVYHFYQKQAGQEH